MLMVCVYGIGGVGGGEAIFARALCAHKPRLHWHSDPDSDPYWLHLHGGKLDSNPDSNHLSMWIVIQIRIQIRDLVLV